MLTDDYAAWQPTKVNTGASFNLLQSRRSPCRPRLRCTGLLTTPSLRRIFPSRSQACPCKQRAALLPRLPGAWQEQRDRRQPREGTGGRSATGGAPQAPCLPSILFVLRPSEPQALHSGLLHGLPARPMDPPAGGAGSADGEHGQVLLPASPQEQESGRLLDSSRGIGQFPYFGP